MEAIFTKLLEQLNASVFTLIAVLIITIWLVFKAGKWSESFEGFKKKNDKTDGSIEKITKSLSKIQATTDLLYQAHLSTVKSQSPLQLTDKGKRVAESIAVDDKIDSHWPKIQEEFNKKGELSNPYDIQNFAMEIARDCFDNIFNEDERNQIKTYAFTIGLNLLEVYPVIGIKIRDRIFSEKGIDVSELLDKKVPQTRK